MKTIYIILIILIWINVFLGNDISKSVVALLTTLLLINLWKRDKNDSNKRNN
ncbi:hypothetical protein AXF04_05335 [Staphylococcus aureus]|nr:hypothetical protein BZP34_07490 [Staphylococcus aureus]MCL9693107.1 hypothetical protein [Staphylococcus aureus]ORN43293.1 hypothetical protein B8A21_11800 [Staphylococcus aureus]OTG42442.1 hypothetical protein B7G60_07490 [Staphylococcus aureus]PTY45613.1 hypothetical protein B1T33_08685 [Staphylococcus aureus]